MYKIGDKIVYPMHGAGIVEKIETKTILDKKREYYILDVPGNDMKIMIPVDQTETIGIRDVIDKKKVNGIVDMLKAPSTEMPQNWNRRYRANMEKLKTGEITEVTEVVRNLTRTEREKHLSTGEKKLLSNARHILVSELILAADISSEDAEKILDDAI
jgi:CarD family transcriptional regulator